MNAMDPNEIIPEDLAAVWEQIWNLLKRGVADKKDAFQTLTLLTKGETFPDPRTVVVRKVLPETCSLLCHSDKRASKVKDIQNRPEIAWHGWHPRRKVQLRMYGRAVIHESGELREEEWANTALSSRMNYSSDLSPGDRISGPEQGTQSYAAYGSFSKDESEKWKENFVVIETRMEKIEWLFLHRSGHLRASFSIDNGHHAGTWMVP